MAYASPLENTIPAAPPMTGGDPSGMSELADRLRGLGQGQNQQRMLDVIGSLRSAAFDEAKLPQLVVVGDQSAGKSSVLDAISGIPIPKDPDGCTRFATEFRLRRGIERISVSIIPSKDRSADDRDRLSRVNRRLTDGAQLGNIIKDCESAIFSSSGQSNQQRFASQDIMTIEISGPTMPLLTLVDLPGIIHAPNSKQTAEDMKAIKKIALDYMKRPRTVILAVVSGGYDYANQIVLEMALNCDKGGSRTLGIVTKPDLASSTGLEDKFLRLVKNEDIGLDLGWHVLRNRTFEEGDHSADVRNRSEQDFFSQGKWSVLPRGMSGVQSLVAKLSLLLHDRIADCLPELLGEIKQELECSEEELRALGHRIETESEMKTELATLFSKSRNLIERGMHGEYNDPDQREFFPPIDSRETESPRKLRARVVLENVEFEKEIRLRGCKFRLVSDGTPDERGGASDSDPGRRVRKDYIEMVEEHLKRSRGRQPLEDYDPLLVYDLFSDYSTKWDDIACNHKDRIQSIANEFLQQAVDHVWPRRMRARLWSTLLNGQIELRHARAKDELERLFRDRRRCSPIYGPEYEEQLRGLQQKFESERDSNAKQLLLKMLAYYELTSKIFVSNVIVQVVERHLIDGLDKLFDTTEFAKMDKDEVAAIVEEDEDTRSRRAFLDQKVAGLRRAHDVSLRVAMANGQRTNRKPEPGVVDTSYNEEDGKASRRRKRRGVGKTVRRTPSSTSESMAEKKTTAPRRTGTSNASKRVLDQRHHKGSMWGSLQAKVEDSDSGISGQESESKRSGLKDKTNQLYALVQDIFSGPEEDYPDLDQ